MDFGRLRFFVLEVVTNLTRNAAMQITAIGTVAVAIVLLGTFLFVRETTSHIGAQLLSRIEISVFLDDNADDAAAAKIQARLQSDHRIIDIRYVPRNEGLKEMSRRMHGEIDTSLLTSNPLPNAFRIQVDSPAHVALVAAHVEKIPGVARVNYAKEIVAKLLRISEVVQAISVVLVVALGVVSAIIITNTIRLTVYARRREIAIMQLVGATNSYIRAPFICEGMVDGLIGSLIAVGLLYGAHVEILPRLIGALPFLPLANAGVDEQRIVLELLGAGAGVGAVSSWFAVGRYLRV